MIALRSGKRACEFAAPDPAQFGELGPRGALAHLSNHHELINYHENGGDKLDESTTIVRHVGVCWRAGGARRGLAGRPFPPPRLQGRQAKAEADQ